jgi:hypothetical protein
MHNSVKTTIAAAFMAGSALVAASPSQAASIGISIGGPGFGIAYSNRSGGYCDRWGCPGNYWGYPVYYGPVYYGGSWFQGPLYYRYYGGMHQYWLHGGWHNDEWRGERPGWARTYHYGPALGLDWYRGHGFAVRDNDWGRWNAWTRTHNWDRDHGDWNRDHDWRHDTWGHDTGNHDWGHDNRWDRNHNPPGEVHHDKTELHQDKVELKQDRRDPSSSRGELRHDRKEIHQDKKELHQDKNDRNNN